MATIVGHLQARLSATSAAFAQDMDKATKSVKGFGKGFTQTLGPAIAFGGAIGAGFAAINTLTNGIRSAISSLAQLANEQIQLVDAAREVAARLDITTDQLMAYHFAAKLANVESGQLNGALTRMAKAVSAAAEDGGKLNEPFERLGLHASDLIGMSIDKQFEAIAEAISKIENPSDRARAAIAIFGKSGAQLMGVLSGGRSALREATARFHELAGTLEEVDAATLGAVADSMDELSVAFDGLARTLTTTFGPALRDTMQLFTELLVEARKLEATDVFNPAGAFMRAMVSAVDRATDPARDAEAVDIRRRLRGGIDGDDEDDGGDAIKKSVTDPFAEASKQIADAQRELDRFGKSAADIAEMELRELFKPEGGFSPNDQFFEAMVQQARALAEELEAAKKEAEGLEELDRQFAEHQDKIRREAEATQREQEDAAKRVKESIRTPEEELADRISELQALEAKGLLSGAETAKAIAQARADILPAATGPEGGVGAGGAAALGSSEAASIILRSMNIPGAAKAPEEKTAKNTEEIKKNGAKQVAHLDRLVINTAPLANLVTVEF